MDSPPARKKEWLLTEQAFNGLLSWLDPDREVAARRYEEIRRRLIKIFISRGSCLAEEMADETFNRVSQKVPEIVPDYKGDPALYFYGVANKVHLEYLRKKARPSVPPPPVSSSEEDELEYECLEQCLQELTPENRELVLQYYQDEKTAKINHRKRLAVRLGIGLNALRIRAHRIRTSLHDCVLKCTNQGAT